MKFTILCDLDGIVTDLLEPFLKAYNDTYNDRVSKSDVIHYHLHHNLKKDVGEKVYEIFHRPHFFLDLPAIPGALQGIQDLQDMGHEVLITTAASGSKSATDKLEWVKKNLGIDQGDVFVCHKKYKIRADVFIDDSPDNLRDYRKAWPFSGLVTIDYPYNHNCPDGQVNFVAKDYKNTEQAWDQIIKYVCQQSLGPHRPIWETPSGR